MGRENKYLILLSFTVKYHQKRHQREEEIGFDCVRKISLIVLLFEIVLKD